ncbi:MAG: phage tail sheath family protein [Thermodesulfatator sp.]|nr:MAG: phage tail sheath family protein [Thermodesulfatator sp.]
MAFTHGVYVEEVPTPITAVREVDSALPFVVGVAPVHNLPEGRERPVNQARLIADFTEFVETFGGLASGEDPANFGLYDFARVYFTLYGMSPAVFVNVFDPETHYSTVSGESVTFGADDQAHLAHRAVSNVVVKSQDGATTYTAGTDYTLEAASGTLTRLSGGAIPAGATVQVDYQYADPTKVTSAEVIGGVDAATDTRTGLELVEEVFPRFGKIVGLILAPGFSQDPTVANVLIAKAELINQHFKAMAYIDVPATVETPTEAVAFKQNFGSPHAVFFWPRVMEGNRPVWLSLHAAGLTAKVDWGNDGVPYESPSNKELRVTGPEKVLLLQEANYLNEQGVVTVHRMMTGWKLWGNRTAAFPENTDLKDAFIACRRMANWIENNLVVNTWQKVDLPINRRVVQGVADTANIWLNGLTGRGYLLGARVEFLERDNPVTQLANGKVVFRVYYLAPPPAETITFLLEVDLQYFEEFFERR